MHRPPSQPVDDLLMFLVNVFDVVNVEKTLFYLMSDFNIDLLNVGKVKSVNDFFKHFNATFYDSFNKWTNSCYWQIFIVIR